MRGGKMRRVGNKALGTALLRPLISRRLYSYQRAFLAASPARLVSGDEKPAVREARRAHELWKVPVHLAL